MREVWPFAGFCVALFGFFEQGSRQFFEARIGDEGYGVADAFGLAIIVDLGHRETRVGPQLISTSGHTSLKRSTILLKIATAERLAWVLPGLKTAVIN